MSKIINIDEHQKFSELCALAMSGALSSEERAQLQKHLGTCAECCEAYSEYSILNKEGMPSLAAEYATSQEISDESVESARSKLVSTLPALESREVRPDVLGRRVFANHSPFPHLATMLLGLAAAACLVLAVGVASYRFGAHSTFVSKTSKSVNHSTADTEVLKLAAEKKAVNDLLATQTIEFDRLRAETAEQKQELTKLQSDLKTSENQVAEIAKDKNVTEEQLRAATQARDTFAREVEEKERAYNVVLTELTHARMERDKALLQLTSFEEKVDGLSAANREQQQLIDSQREYLASDKDIRELMGARQLYIADIFDVAKDQTRKPYGRVFYTRGKELVFYAFDLDRQAKVRQASAFQVWGQKGARQDDLTSLGILFMDSESSQRWALRVDDPAKLEEVNALFVTIEPHGGSAKPTGKPFLYAYLKKEPNHP
jgi:hypothetical protein